MARVQHFDDVRVLRGDDLARARELAGPIGQRDAQLEVTLPRREAVADDALHDERVDVAAREDDDGRTLRAHLALHDGGDSDGAGRLDDEFGALEQHEHGLRDVVLLDRDDFVDGVADDREVESARSCDGDAVGDGRADRDVGRLSRGERDGVRGGVGGLHADDADRAPLLGGASLEHARDATREPASPDRDDDGLEVGHLLEQLEPERALTRNDIGVVERRDVDGARALGILGGGLKRLRHRVAPQHDLGSVVTCGLELGQGDPDGHEDRGVDAQLARGEGHALRVIAGTRGDDTARALLLGEPRHARIGSTNLVRAGALQVLALE